MPGGRGLGGRLFPKDYLEEEEVRKLPEWGRARRDLDEHLEAELRALRHAFPAGPAATESLTEDEFIWKVLRLLGWTDFLRQQNLSSRGRRDVPDGVLYRAPSDKEQALAARG